MKTQQQVEEMKENTQKRIDECHRMALMQNSRKEAEKWFESKRQFIAQYNILLEVLHG